MTYPAYMIKRQEIVAKLVDNFPIILETGTVSLGQINETLGLPSAPTWMVPVGDNFFNISEYIKMTNENIVENVVAIRTPKITPKTNGYIPDTDPNFVPFGIYKDLDQILKAKTFFPVYVSGMSGNGKSATIIEICAKRKLPVIRVNVNNMTDEEQLIGSKTLKNGNIEIVEGPVLTAMRNGYVLLLEELDFSSPAILSLQGILEGKPYYFKLNNEMIYPHTNFNIVATGNTKGKGSEDGRYIGTNILNEAFLERFGVTLEQEYPTNATEYKIVSNTMKSFDCFDEGFAKVIVKWAEAIRITFNAGGVDETMSTRRIIHIIKAFSIYKNKKKAVELCCNRFDLNTKLAFIDLFEKIAGEPEPVEEVVNLDPELPTF